MFNFYLKQTFDLFVFLFQLQAALLDIHDIFFEIPVGERMALIEQTRMKELEKRVRVVSL